MKSFRLLKYRRNNGSHVGATGIPSGRDAVQIQTNSSSTITSLSDQQSDSNEENHVERGPFFDLEFTDDCDDINVGGGDEIEDIICVDENDQSSESDDDIDNERELSLKVSSVSSSGDSTDRNIVCLSPQDDLFFKGRLVPLSEPNSTKKSSNFRVLLLKLKKSSKTDTSINLKSDVLVPEMPQKESKKKQKLFRIKFKVGEMPIVGLITGSSKSKTEKNDEKVGENERGFSKEALQKYLKKVKPLYVRVSKRCGNKLGISSPAEKPKKVSEVQRRRNVRTQKQVSLPARLRVVRKHLRKSKLSAAVATASSPPLVSKRSDESFVLQEDGIQSAIMHCKKSFQANIQVC